MEAHNIIINNDGSITFIYSDNLVDLCQEGSTEIKRVSNVEPDPKGGWTATMVDGTILGPYLLRQQALDAEVKYLEEQLSQ